MSLYEIVFVLECIFFGSFPFRRICWNNICVLRYSIKYSGVTFRIDDGGGGNGDMSSSSNDGYGDPNKASMTTERPRISEKFFEKVCASF